jgi:hypothetical protein
MTVQTAPSAICAILFVTPAGAPSVAQGLGPKTADAVGRVSWSWVIEANATPGTGTVTVTCNGMSASAGIQISA